LTYKVTDHFKLEKKIKSNLPPRFDQNSIEAISDFFLMNKIEYSDKSSIFGLLQDGGVSNYWGMSCDFPATSQLNFLNEKNRKSLIDSFNYIYNKYNFEGSVFNTNIQNIKDKRIEDFFNKFLKIKDSNISFYKNCSAVNTLKCTKLNDQCWIKCPTNSTLLPNMMKNNYENIILNHGYFLHNRVGTLLTEEEKKKIVLTNPNYNKGDLIAFTEDGSNYYFGIYYDKLISTSTPIENKHKIIKISRDTNNKYNRTEILDVDAGMINFVNDKIKQTYKTNMRLAEEDLIETYEINF
jgi:hypothetical protein